MKKAILSLAVLALVAACGQDNFTVKGTITDADQLPEQASIIIADNSGNEISTAPIVDGTFTLTGKATGEKMYIVKADFPDRDKRDARWMAPFIPEKGTVTVTLSSDGFEVEGGPINQAFDEFQDKISDIYMGMGADYEAGMARIADLCKETISNNPDNVLSLMALNRIIYDMDVEELDGILAGCGSFVREDEAIKSIRDAKKAEISTAEGQPFVDFEGKTPEGSPVKLSDFVGKGRWVLADFWASWCGPCMREIPNIKKTHETLSGDSFTVLGVAVWDGDEDGGNTKSLAQMEKMGMTWPQIFVGNDRTPTEAYGIVGIPTMILFAPDGTIYKRGEGLRGENMPEIVGEIIGK